VTTAHLARGPEGEGLPAAIGQGPVESTGVEQRAPGDVVALGQLHLELAGLTPRGRWYRLYLKRAITLDVLAALGAGAVGMIAQIGAASVTPRLVVAGVLPPLWLAILLFSRAYTRRFVGATPEEYRNIGRAVGWLALFAAVLSYGAKYELARGIVIVVLPTLLVLALLGRRTARNWLYHERMAGRQTQRTVVIGDVRTVGRMVRQIRRARNEGLHVVAVCASRIAAHGDVPSTVEGVPVFGYPDEAMHAIDLFDAEVVVVTSDPDLSGPALRRLAWTLEDRGVDLMISPGLFEVAGPRLSIRPAAGMPLLYVERPVMSGFRRLAKGLVDQSLTLCVLLAALPVFLVIVAAIRLDGPGPVLFRQRRVGEGGTEFSMLKFRTMVVDAEERLAEISAAADVGNTVLFKMRSDPRVTRVGRVLRRFSLDELPQLINVLRGEMSLIGPRPPLPAEVARYEDDAVRRLRVKPGITGLWQVSGRSDLTWEQSVRLDLWYVDNWSLVLDMQILGRTAKAVLHGQGAY
jgi:exopolysaccharide biosynthesis polyprenyl glycosylphosphotransferase